MGASSGLIEKLGRLPRSERWDELRAVVLAEFRTVLLMADDEPLPEDESCFSLGVTSLGLMDVKDRLELHLGAPISAAALFNHPTINRLMEHLTGEVRADLFGGEKEVLR